MYLEGEKLLGSLGGMFSKTWKPEKMACFPTNNKHAYNKFRILL